MNLTKGTQNSSYASRDPVGGTSETRPIDGYVRLMTRRRPEGGKGRRSPSMGAAEREIGRSFCASDPSIVLGPTARCRRVARLPDHREHPS